MKTRKQVGIGVTTLLVLLGCATAALAQRPLFGGGRPMRPMPPRGRVMQARWQEPPGLVPETDGLPELAPPGPEGDYGYQGEEMLPPPSAEPTPAEGEGDETVYEGEYPEGAAEPSLFDYVPYDAPPDRWAVGPDCPGLFRFHCDAVWFVTTQVQLLQRAHSEQQAGITAGTLNSTLGVITATTPFTIVNQPLFDTEAANYEMVAGPRITVGRFLGYDDHQRVHSLEGQYWGTQEWNAEARFDGQQIEYFGPDSNGDNLLDIVTSGNLLSHFPLDIGGFNLADTHSFSYQSRVNSAQLDYRVRWTGEKDQLVAKHDGRWVREHNVGWVHSVHGGLRYINVNEDFVFSSRGQASIRNSANAAPGVVVPYSGDWFSTTECNLFGLQGGADLTRQWDKWSLGVRGLFGLGTTFNELNGRISVNDPIFPLTVPADQRSFSNSWHFDEQNFAVFGETGFEAVYRLTRHINVRGSWDFYWIQGVALASEQYGNHQKTGPTAINVGGISYNGPSFGIDMVW
ncbi:MAG: BBP7 family outer membrane beta-barrel protein [Pirellulales bacterium]|nr:BBP7 family outer membrane beta-barrel protein [Pirellulales bacterium]